MNIKMNNFVTVNNIRFMMRKMNKLVLCLSFLLLPFAVKAQTTQGRFGYLSYNAIFQAMPEYEVSRQKLADLKSKYDKEAQRSEEEFQRKFAEFLQGQKEFPENILLKRQHELQDLLTKSIRFKEESQKLLVQAEKDLQADMRDLSLWHPFEGGVEEAVRLASAVEEAVFEADERIVNSDGTNFSTSSGEFTLANSLGFCAGYRYSRHDMDAAPIAEDDSGMQRDGWWTQGRAVGDLLDPAELGRTAAGRTVARLGARPLSSRRARVLFDAPVATGLLDILEELLNGRAWYRHASCLEGGLGERILPAHVSVEEDPYLMRALGSGVFDDEGCAGRRRMIVSDGRIEGIFLSSYSARRLGMRTTGNLGGAYNLRLSSTETRPEDTRRAMLERLGTGFLVTELIGQGLNAVSGDYSRGASGFWVENGRIVAPVEGVTIASNILTMMKTIEAIGADEHDTGVRRSGSLLIPDLMLAGE